MKNTITVLLALFLLLTVLVSCGKKDDDVKQDVTTGDTSAAESTETETDVLTDTETKKPMETKDVDDIEDEDPETRADDTGDDTAEENPSVIGKWTNGGDSIEFTDGGICKRTEQGVEHEYEYIAENGRIVFFDGNTPCGDASYTVKGGKLILADEGGTVTYEK